MNIQKVSDAFCKSLPYKPTKDQENAIEMLAEFLFDNSGHSVFLLKGYAGTGKTTLVSSLVKILPSFNIDFILLAPTGRAAKVLSLYSGEKAFTIHKKIYRLSSGNDGITSFVRAQNRHKNTLFVVDEASMINTKEEQNEQNLFESNNVFEDLVDYVYNGNNCKMLLIGDNAQLPPVGMNLSPALDEKYIKSRYSLSVTSTELNQVVRQAYESGILNNATLLRKKTDDSNKKKFKFKLSDFDDVKKPEGWELEDIVVDSFSSNERDKSVIICRSNRRANLYNQQIRNRVLFFEEELSAGDYLMATKNNYFWLPKSSDAGFIANGDMMEVLRIYNFEERYGYRFADVSVKLKDYPEEPVLELKILIDSLHVDKPSLSFKDLNKLYEEIDKDYSDIPEKRKRYLKIKNDKYYNALQVKFGYALTCHKSQGGQWENVFVEPGIIKDGSPDIEFYRWLYTAITRATKKLYLIGFSDDFFC